MLYRLEMENFSCFREEQILDLSVSKIPAEHSERFAPVFPDARLSAPKAVFIFGANASGKSTVLKALNSLVWFMGHGYGNNTDFLYQPFNHKDTLKQPMCLAMEFGGPMDLDASFDAKEMPADMPVGTYRYEIEIVAKEGPSTPIRINRETLRQRPGGTGKWKRVFERIAGEKTLGSKMFPLSGYAQVLDKVPSDASVIGTLAEFKHRAAQVLIRHIRTVASNILVDKHEPGLNELASTYQQDPNALANLNRELQRFDTGIEEMSIAQGPEGPFFLFRHANLPREMNWFRESTGTRSFIKHFPYIFYAQMQGSVAIIDELDTCIHPLLMPEILAWFYNPSRNSGNAQLWATCHTVPLMNNLLKEEIVLCEKDVLSGQASTYGLKDVRPIRKAENFPRNYMSGAYGGIPCVG